MLGGKARRDRELEEQRRELEELNEALDTLAHMFPDIQVEVFREMLMLFDGASRLQVCVEQLLRDRNKWVKGRWKVPKETTGEISEIRGNTDTEENLSHAEDGASVPPHERFRSADYKAAAKAALCKEFSTLSRSTIEAVLAEVNFSYTRARPTVEDLSRRTWRAILRTLNPFRRKKDKSEHMFLTWVRSPDGEGMIPQLKQTGCAELDQELHETLLAPLLREKQRAQEARDEQLAAELNENEARAADALFECQCCLDEVTFEQIATCSIDAHVICYNCIRRTLHEAVFGQGWDRSVDAQRFTLRCLAPLSHGTCEGYLSPELVKAAILSEKAGAETFRKFEERVATDALLRSQLKLIRCPFCSYAEVDPIYHPPESGLDWRFRRGNFLYTVFMTVFILDMIPVLIIPFLILAIFFPTTLTNTFRTSLRNLCLRTRGQRFICANPACGQASCITCRKAWRDPHVCHEPLLLSLRTTVEAARTAAIKRTCPRCGLSFVKSSGCNKLTCVCGYSMCYLCRKALSKFPFFSPASARSRRPPPADDKTDDDSEDEDSQGYKHFCEHFRINPGTRCTECNKCDLYLAEDEEAIARKAGEKAEREWRMRQALLTDPSYSNNSIPPTNQDEILSSPLASILRKNREDSNFSGGAFPPSSPSAMKSSSFSYRYWLYDCWREGRWKWELQGVMDWVVEMLIVVRI